MSETFWRDRLSKYPVAQAANPLFEDKNSFTLFTEWEITAIAKLLPSKCRVLDYGCGDGRLALGLAKLGHKVLACDECQEMLAHVPHHQNLQVLAKTTVDPKAWDVLLLAHVLPYLSDDAAEALLTKLLAFGKPVIVVMPPQAKHLGVFRAPEWHARFGKLVQKTQVPTPGSTEFTHVLLLHPVTMPKAVDAQPVITVLGPKQEAQAQAQPVYNPDMFVDKPAKDGQVKTLSVIVSTYNRQHYLSLALDRLRTFSFITEIIVADDGSDDGTWDYLAQVMKEEPRLRRARQEHFGYRLARLRNIALSMTTGDYIISLDDDNLQDKNFFDLMLAAVAGRQDTFAVAHEPNDWKHIYYQKLGHHEIMRTTEPWIYIGGGMTIGHRDAWASAGGFPDDFIGWGGEDTMMAFRHIQNGGRITVVPDAVMEETRQREAVVSFKKRNEQSHNVMAIKRRMVAWNERMAPGPHAKELSNARSASFGIHAKYATSSAVRMFLASWEKCPISNLIPVVITDEKNHGEYERPSFLYSQDQLNNCSFPIVDLPSASKTQVDNPDVSICIASQVGRENMLICAVLSALGQLTTCSTEILVSIDGEGHDPYHDAYHLLRQLGVQVLFTGTQAGVAKSRNMMNLRARGTWLMVFDDDDMLVRGAVDSLWQAALAIPDNERETTAVLFGNWTDFGNVGFSTGQTQPLVDLTPKVRPFLLMNFLHGTIGTHGASLQRRDVMVQLGYDQTMLRGADFAMFCRMFSQGYWAQHIQAGTILRRRHMESMTQDGAVSSKEQKENSLRGLRLLTEPNWTLYVVENNQLLHRMMDIILTQQHQGEAIIVFCPTIMSADLKILREHEISYLHPTITAVVDRIQALRIKKCYLSHSAEEISAALSDKKVWTEEL